MLFIPAAAVAQALLPLCLSVSVVDFSARNSKMDGARGMHGWMLHISKGTTHNSVTQNPPNTLCILVPLTYAMGRVRSMEALHVQRPYSYFVSSSNHVAICRGRMTCCCSRDIVCIAANLLLILIMSYSCMTS